MAHHVTSGAARNETEFLRSPTPQAPVRPSFTWTFLNLLSTSVFCRIAAPGNVSMSPTPLRAGDCADGASRRRGKGDAV